MALVRKSKKLKEELIANINKMKEKRIKKMMSILNIDDLYCDTILQLFNGGHMFDNSLVSVLKEVNASNFREHFLVGQTPVFDIRFVQQDQLQPGRSIILFQDTIDVPPDFFLPIPKQPLAAYSIDKHLSLLGENCRFDNTTCILYLNERSIYRN